MPTNTAKSATPVTKKTSPVAKKVVKPAPKPVAKKTVGPVVKTVVKTATKPAAKTVAKIAVPVVDTVKTKAFMKALQPSDKLAVILGSKKPLPRTEVTKLLWVYIKSNKLQNPANMRNILCDAPLKAVMGKREVTMFEMSGLIGKHLTNI